MNNLAMKTEKIPFTSRSGGWSQIKMLTLAAGLAVAAASVLAQPSSYTNSTGDFNVPNSWSPNGVPSGNINATDDNTSNNVVLIQAGDPPWSHGDTLAGNADGTSGAYLQTGSTNNTGYPAFGNWLRLGIGTGSTGYYTLSNGVVNVAGRTQIGEKGTGYLEIDNGVYTTGYNGNPGIVAGNGDFGISSGTLVINGGAVTNVSNETWFGEGNGCLGNFYMNGGVMAVNNWFVFGRNGGTGFGAMTAGTLTLTGSGQFLIGGGGVGALAQSGGTINVFNQYLVPQGNGGGGGTGTNTLSGSAVLNLHSWIAVGRGSGYGELNISGNATLTRDNFSDGNSHFDIGTDGRGILNQNGGTITELSADLWIGESASGTWNFNSGSAFVKNVVLCVNSSASGQLNLNGGLFQASGINSYTTGDVSLLNLNGATLQANANNTTFISGLYQASIGSGGVTIDSQNFTITIPQPLVDAGGGTLAKIGSGSLTLSGANSYSGTTAVNAGFLGTTTASSGDGNYTVASGAILSVQVVGSLNSQLNTPSLTFAGPASTLVVDLGNFGNPTAAPINASTLTVNGTVSINVLDTAPQIGQFPLIAYGSKTGTGYVLGSLPPGLVGHLVDNAPNNTIDLAITSINLPRWDGNAGGNWDIGLTTNWINTGTGLPTYYSQGNAVIFDDNATGTTNVNLVAAVTPGSVTINNNTLTYTLAGSGSINGATGVLKEGAGSFALDTTNGYTGATVISGGTLIANNLANGGSPSAIGASPAIATNLVIGNATLSYTGPAVTINRGYWLDDTNCDIDTEGDLTLDGLVTAVSTADFMKSGPAQLTYGAVGINTLSGTTSLGYRTIQGTTKFDGSAGGQTNNVLGHFGVGGLGGTNATVIVTNATLNVATGGFDLGRSGGATGTLDIYNGGVVNSASGNFALGDGGGVVSTGVVNQAGGTLNVHFGPSIFVGQNIGGVGIYNLSGGTLNIDNWLAVGRQGGYGVINLSGTGTIVKTGGGNIDIGNSGGVANFAGTGVLNQSGGAITNTASQTWFGEGSAGQPVSGVWNMTGGTATLGELHVGIGGTGTSAVNLSGSAIVNCAGYVDFAQDASATANLNLGSATQPGGSLTAQGDLTVGDVGTATVNMVTNGGGLLTVQGTLYLSRGTATANGTVNLNPGSTIVAAYINNGWGFGNGGANTNPQAFNFNGGTLRAYVGSPYFIQPSVNAVVNAGGAVIDDGGNAITILARLANGGGNGGLTKIGNGTLYLAGANTYTGTTRVSAGTLAGSGVINGPVMVAAGGTLAAGSGALGGVLTINNSLTFASGGASLMKVGASANDQIVGLTGVAYNGNLIVTNTSGSPLMVGKTYVLFNAAAAGTGNFTSVTIQPSGAGTFNPTTGVLTITSAGAGLTIGSVKISGGNLILTGTGGAANSGYTLLTTTNLLIPQANWTTNTTGTLDGNGSFSNGVPVNPSQPAAFFRIRTP